MIDTRVAYPEGEDARLAECVLEPLRRPGAVQPHGVLVVLDAGARVVREVSESLEAIFGMSVVDVIGHPFSEMVGGEVADAARALAESEVANADPATIGGAEFDMIVHRSGDAVVVEFEPAAGGSDRPATTAVFSAVHRLARSSTRDEIWAETAIAVRALTGFDRVMVYHFHEDGHGQVVAEQAAGDMEPYLGLHYPASDIPAQARELYLSKLSRAIVSSTGETSALLSTDAAGAVVSTIDLGMAELRSVSPHHLQFMRNMGQASTLSFSLVHAGALIGMITCAHRSPHRVEYAVRQGIEVLANQVALQLGSMAEIERLRRQVELRAVRALLLADIGDVTQVADALLGGETTMLTLVPAEGAVVVVDGHVTSRGRVPDETLLLAAGAVLKASSPGRRVVTEALEIDAPALAAVLPDVAGLIVVPLGAGDDYLAWFRPEVAQSVEWLGDMAPANRLSTLSPRNSFSSWTESVSRRSLPWGGLELEANELSRDLDGLFLRRAEAELAELALVDPLTGLPNRRLFVDRLEHGLTKYARGEELSLLYLDIDGFKHINDRHGHEVGDLLLVHVADTLRRAIRDQDTVARLGGDEFVVLCENTTAEEADVVAGRILSAIRLPIVLGDATILVTASIGVAAADHTFAAADLLREADTAMYRAKNRGRDRAAR